MIQRAVVINALGFQLVWWAMALGLPQSRFSLIVLVSLAHVALHLRQSADARAEFKAMAASVALGLAVDTALIQWAQVTVHPANPAPLASVQPWWLLLLWICLGCTLRSSMKWICDWPRLGAALCAVAGVLSYQAAVGFGLMDWQGLMPYAILVVAWGVCFPVLVLWSNGRLRPSEAQDLPSSSTLSEQSDTAPH